MPSAPTAHRSSGLGLETSQLPVLLCQTHAVQQEVHSVPGSRSELRIIPTVELSRRLIIQGDFKSLSTIATTYSKDQYRFHPCYSESLLTIIGK